MGAWYGNARYGMVLSHSYQPKNLPPINTILLVSLRRTKGGDLLASWKNFALVAENDLSEFFVARN